MSDNAQPARPGVLHIVATPIGNLRDITLHALDVLRTVDIVAAEDTRHSQQLLSAYGIQANLVAVHEHNEAAAAVRVVEALRQGKSVAYVSDAGTPGISDPGARLVRTVREACLPVAPIPGPSAVVTLLSAAGLEGPWMFHGFLPAKAVERRKVLERLRVLHCALVFYEAPHRIVETVNDLASVLGGERQITLGRELTKRFEQIHAASLAQAVAWLQADENHQRGEFVLIIEAIRERLEDNTVEMERVLAILLETLPVKQAAQLAARLTGERKNRLYECALRMRSRADGVACRS